MTDKELTDYLMAAVLYATPPRNMGEFDIAVLELVKRYKEKTK